MRRPCITPELPATNRLIRAVRAGGPYTAVGNVDVEEVAPPPRPSIKIVNLPGLPDGGDAVNFIAERRGGGHE